MYVVPGKVLHKGRRHSGLVCVLGPEQTYPAGGPMQEMSQRWDKSKKCLTVYEEYETNYDTHLIQAYQKT